MKLSHKIFLCSLFFLLFGFCSSYVHAETNIYGGAISIDTTWTRDASSSPYIIHASTTSSSTLTVDVGATLIIEAGTIVKFDYGQSISVLGKLISNGTADEKIYFTSIDDSSVGEGIDFCAGFSEEDLYLCEDYIEPYNDDWSGIEVMSGGNVNLNNSVISYAETGLYSESSVALLDYVDVKNCINGIYGYESTININNSNINNLYSDALIIDSTSSVSIISSNIKDIDGDGISVVDNSVLNIENSTIENILGDAFFIYSNSTTSIKSSTISTIGGDVFGAYYNSYLNFENSTSTDILGKILYMFGESVVDIKNSIIENTSDGIIFYNNSFLNIFDSQINNVAGRDSWTPFLEFYNGSHLDFSNSVLQNVSGTVIEAYGNGWSGYSTTTLNISGSTISFGDNIGLQIYGNKMETNVSKSKIQNFAGDGIQAFSYPNILITDSYISNNDNGIVSWGSNIEISNSVISENTIYGISNNPAISGAPSINAVSNWWGDAPGPYNVDTNASGTANQVSWNIAYQPWLTSIPGAKSKCCSNVLFIPGLEASRLYKTDSEGNEVRVWEPEVFHDNSVLFLDSDGQPKNSDIYTKDIIDNAYLPIKGNIYESFISSMNEMKSTGVINDWKSVPYDWRLSFGDLLNSGKEYPDGKIYFAGELASTSDPYIISELRRLASSSATGKVTIIAHSNGGLITKELTNKLGAEASTLIDQIIFVAVPQAGTPAAVGALLHGFQQGLPKDWLPLFISPSESRELGKNMSSAYNLLPFSQYFNYVSNPVIIFDNSDLLAGWREKYGNIINSGEGLYNFLSDQSREVLSTKSDLVSLPSLNINLLDSSKKLHDTKLDSWTVPDGVSLTEIAGWGEDTLSGIEYYQGIKTECVNPNVFSTCSVSSETPVLEYRPKITYDGDGTVVVPSALWTASSISVNKYWVNLQDYDTFKTLERKHADILEVSELRSFIQNIITQSSSSLPEYISTSTPTKDDLEKHLHFTLHSPLSLDLYDEQGNHTGISTTTDELEENIPGSRYITFGEVKYISVPASFTIYLSMRGYSSGSFTLDIEEVQGGIITASTTFAGIPSSTSTIATINIPNGNISSTSPLVVDINGDGTTEINLSSKLGDTVVPDFLKNQISLARHRSVSLVATSSELLVHDYVIATTTIVSVFASGTKNGGLSLRRNEVTGKGESSVFTSNSTTTRSLVVATTTKKIVLLSKNDSNQIKFNLTGQVRKGESSVFTKSSVGNQSLLASVGNIPFGDNIIQYVVSFIKNIINKIHLWYNH